MAQITKLPDVMSSAYGKNIISFFDDDNDGARVIKINQSGFDYSDAPILIEYKIVTNPVGYMHLDIQDFLKNQVSHNPTIEYTNKLTTSNHEVFMYRIWHSLVGGGSYSYSIRFTINSRDNYTDSIPNLEEYYNNIITVELGGISYASTTNKIKALTDKNIEFKLGSQITDGKPSVLNPNEKCWIMEKYWDDDYTLSFMQYFNIATGNVPDFYKGFDFFNIYFYNGNTLLGTEVIQNNDSNGGAKKDDGGSPINNYWSNPEAVVISLQVGSRNTSFNNYENATHFYVVATALAVGFGELTFELSDFYRFNIIQPECNDEHLEVSWVNTFGFRDYFTFTKKINYSVRTNQSTYQQLDADWAGTTINTNSYSRGVRVFNKSQEVEYTASTRFLSDLESEFLKNLYLSPDVKVRFSGSTDWTSVILTSSTYDNKKFKYDKLFQHTITFKLANKNQIQKG